MSVKDPPEADGTLFLLADGDHLLHRFLPLELPAIEQLLENCSCTFPTCLLPS